MMRMALPGALALLALVPFLTPSQYLANLALLIATSAALGQCWNLSSGFGGLTSFGHAAFFGLGAYTDAVLQSRYGVSPWIGLLAGILMGGAAGFGIGVSAFRAGVRGSYFALITLAFAEAFRVIANSLDVTNGGLGILLPLRPGLGTMQFTDRRAAYAAALLLLISATGCAAWLARSRFGALLAAVRENEDAARALGVPALRVKSTALALSGALTGAAGVLYVQTYLYIDPTIAFSVERSVEMLLVAMIGGAGTVLGPILGAIALHAVADTARGLIDTPGFAPMLYGLMLLLIVALLPGGIARLRRA